MTFLDRVNIGVASIHMNGDIGLTATAFGIGSSLFFVTYILFEVPSNALMHRIGARVWIPRILISIGLVSGATAFIQGETSFYIMRLLLGVAEAGAAPAFVLFLSLWFPPRVRPRIMALYLLAVPVASIVGSPLSILSLHLDGLFGLVGWRWVFICPAILTILIGVACYFLLVDTPDKAKWLSPTERAELAAELEAEAEEVADKTTGRHRYAQLLKPAFIALAIAHLTGNLANYTLSFFLPQIIKTLGTSDTAAAGLSALPYAVGGIAVAVFGWHATKYGRGPLNLALPFAIGLVGFIVAGTASNHAVVLIGLSLGAVAGLGYLPAFWSLPATMFRGAVLAVAIGAVNSFSLFGGLIGPSVMGYLKDTSGSFGSGLMFCAVVVGIGAVLTFFALRAMKIGTAQGEGPAEVETSGATGAAENAEKQEGGSAAVRSAHPVPRR
ncbi:MFS transporter [Streptomyces sp. NPDC001393]